MDKKNQYLVLKDTRKLGFAEYGKHDGFPIIYCHGSQSSRFEMHYDLSFAVNNDLRIITIDRPGHGISDINPKGTILSFANDVKELIEYLGIDKFSVAGMSAGSPFALGIAYIFPKNTCSVAIISGFAPFVKETKKYLSKEVRVMLNLAKSFPFLLKLMLKFQAKQVAKNPKKALYNFLKIMSKPDQEVLKNEEVMKVIESMFKEAFRNGSSGVAYEVSNILVCDWGFELSEVQIPVTFYQGGNDNNVPFEWAEFMTSKISNAELKKYPDEGHLIIFKHVKEIFTSLKVSLFKEG
ncbi:MULTISPECIES: alpha/beta fold hydrolase [unclassified Tenacibaculum]|uniref:alpha/beta fold hydrolase n=1 Tax=unclassified Tenacibaculum TaxID=2635139 RepID=UPI001F15A8A6|nr:MULTISPECIES: alpha/beta hydrolase [unclassified Tenacibaculum]MCF2874406.1 alpha/beta hydrolase [Tenacibaculum sp. Cn5-1]MCF2934987.1 alpha/beta hydrolase [Tenacibaculum sp. Cn5-34]MCG7511197.1 alpha/beta hydrolase [Tenacibaculum sp. Cn5-46]